MLNISKLKLPHNLLLDFQLNPGELIVLTGPSGAGKTLFLKALSGLISCTHEKFVYENLDYQNLDWPKVRSEILYLQQKPVKLSGKVKELLQKPFFYKVNQHKKFDEEKIDQYLKQLYLGQHFLQKNASQLSGGEEQMTAILRSLLLNPKILLLDEPTAAVDRERTLAIEDLILFWKKNSLHRPSIIFVTHDEAQEKRLMQNGGRLIHFSELVHRS